ncbi:HD domain-containing protein [Streptococcus thoraltensis]|uniref:HD domain-containing protein n=1 Tax=Streptococcus thoraltensis TaxID=55085 RepID=UPI001F56D59A|nr:HD domain-containing protein [Streptococcus thoraltensis]
MKEKVFRDPIHNYIHVKEPIIAQLIDSKEFQRLRRIKQVPTTSYTFHGAEHNRFSHCLGVYDIARRVTEIFEQQYADKWNPEESLITMVAGLLHDIGHGAYSHTFELLFETDHEAYTQEIITNPETEVNAILRQVSPDFPEKVASVIDHTYANKQIVQLISSQIDCDRMDYLLRDSYYTGTSYGQFDLTRILRVIQPVENGIAFAKNGMHAVEDYLIGRYQMYMQVYFHPASRAMEVLLQNLLKRAKFLYQNHPQYFQQTSPNLIPFFEKNPSLANYLALDDGVMNTYFQSWITSEDSILKDLASRFINRKLLTSISFDEENASQLNDMIKLVRQTGFDPDYYTGIHINLDLPYDVYKPKSNKPRTQIDIAEKDGSKEELSALSPLVASLSGNIHGDRRFYFPKEMLQTDDLFTQDKVNFQKFISNGHLTSTP